MGLSAVPATATDSNPKIAPPSYVVDPIRSVDGASSVSTSTESEQSIGLSSDTYRPILESSETIANVDLSTNEKFSPSPEMASFLNIMERVIGGGLGTGFLRRFYLDLSEKGKVFREDKLSTASETTKATDL